MRRFALRHGYILFGVLLFICVYSLNNFIPLYSGDDYVYSFVWDGRGMFVPLPPDAARISSFPDIVSSCGIHYLTWAGRVVPQFFSFLFGWVGKGLFNVCNSFVTVSFCFLLAFLSCRVGSRDEFRYFLMLVFLAFFGIWMFNPDVPSTLFWLNGSLNYLWPCFFFSLFVFPFVLFYYYPLSCRNLFPAVLFFSGFFAALFHEALDCLGLWFFFWLGFVLYRGRGRFPYWFVAGLFGFFIGFLVCYLAPGNRFRLVQEALYSLRTIEQASADLKGFYSLRKPLYEFIVSGSGPWWLGLDRDVLFSNLIHLLMVYKIQIVLWFYIFMFFFRVQKVPLDILQEKDLVLVKILLSCTGISYLMFFFLPVVSLRISFFGMVFLVWAFLVCVRLSLSLEIFVVPCLWVRYAVIFLAFGMFLYSFGTGYVCFYDCGLRAGSVLSRVRDMPAGSVFVIKEKELAPVTFYSGFPWFNPSLMRPLPLNSDPGHWLNVSFARYHNIGKVIIE